MDLSAKNLHLITKAVKYMLCELRIHQMAAIKKETLPSEEPQVDIEYLATLVQDIADYTQLHKELETYATHNKYPLSD